MKLTGYKTSPYFRIVHSVCIELGLECELDIVPFMLKANQTELNTIKDKNPLMKIPLLEDGEHVIIDSRVILNHLLRKESHTQNLSYPFTIQEENRLSVIYGMIDAGILRFIMTLDEIDMNCGYMKRSYDRITESLTYLEKEDFNDNNASTLLLICGLEWFTKRNVYDWKQFPEIVKIYDKYKDRESLVETRIPQDA